MIRRAPRPESNFTIVSKAISEDRNLSWAARGLLIYLLGKPDHWQVSIANIINETSESGAPLGRDGVRALCRQLVDAGYLHRLGRVNGDDGRFTHEDYEVTEDPSLMAPEPKRRRSTWNGFSGPGPGTALPGRAKPAPAKTPQASTETKQVLTAASTETLRVRTNTSGLSDIPF